MTGWRWFHEGDLTQGIAIALFKYYPGFIDEQFISG